MLDLTQFLTEAESLQFDGVDPNAKLTDRPLPPEDGVYAAVVKLAPIEGEKPVKTPNGTIINFKGKAIAPTTKKDNGQNTHELADKNGVFDGTLYLTVTVEGPDGHKSTWAEYVSSSLRQTGASAATSLLRALGVQYKASSDLVAFVQQHIQSGLVDPIFNEFTGVSVASLRNLLLLDGMRAMIEGAGADGYKLVTPVEIKTVLETNDPNGKMEKRNGKEYPAKVVKYRGSEKIAAAGEWPPKDESSRLVPGVVLFDAEYK